MMLWVLLLGWSVSGVLSGTTPAPKITLWTPGHLDALHDALLEGRPLRAELTSVRAVRALGGADPAQPSPAKLSLWVPRGQEQQAAKEWQDEWSDRSAVLVREADSDDGLLDEEGYDVEPMSPSWLRGGRGGGAAPAVAAAAAAAAAADASIPTDSNGLGSVVRVPRSYPVPRRLRGSLGHFRRKRSASPGPNEASSEDASVAADTAKKTSAPAPGPGPQQAKAARGHQFITGRGEKEPPPVVREVEAAHPDNHSSPPPPPPPTHASPVAAGSSRIGAGRDALGLRVNEIPQGPRYSSVYESETQRHAADHRHYTADNYGSHNSYATSYGGSYGSYPPYHAMPLPSSPGYGQQPLSPLSSSPSPASHPGPLAPRSAPTATPRRIIYYASLPDPAPAPPGGLPHHLGGHPGLAPPGSSRVPHEYRGPPYDVNGAYSADNRYPPANDNLYRYTIIDAEPPGPLLGYRSTAAPYRDRPAPAAYPQPYHLKPASAAPDAGPQAASPIQYTQYDYNGIGGLPAHLPTDPMSASGARTASSSALVDSKQGLPTGVPLSDDPYRGFNPRQPAPWSMQVGTRLTVKDDGYGSSSPGGPGGLPAGLPPAARRFYVTSQLTSQQQPVGQPQPGPGQQQWQDLRDPRDPYGQPQARFPRPLDRSRSEARNRLFR